MGKTFGTPLQDALRRDITINSLFYNIHSRSVEDHTGKVSLEPSANLSSVNLYDVIGLRGSSEWDHSYAITAQGNIPGRPLACPSMYQICKSIRL